MIVGDGYGFTFAPHFTQNFAPSTICVPQLVQNRLTLSVTGCSGFSMGRVAGRAAPVTTGMGAVIESNTTDVVEPAVMAKSRSTAAPA